MDDTSLRAILETLDPLARDALRRVLIHDQADRDSVSSQLLRYREGHGDDWADIIDMLTTYPEGRRRVVRLLGEIEAAEQSSEAGQDGEQLHFPPFRVSQTARPTSTIVWLLFEVYDRART